MAVPLGQVIYSAVKPIFKIYFIIGIGFFLARKNILTVSTCRDISDAIVTAIMPCLIFDNIVTNIESSDIKNIGVIFFLGTLLYLVGSGLALLIYYTCKSPKAWFGGLISVGLFPNISDLPIAYLQTMSNSGSIFTLAEGAKGVAYVCIFLASQVFYQFSLGLYKLVKYDFRDQLENHEDAESQVHSSSKKDATTKDSGDDVTSDEKSATNSTSPRYEGNSRPASHTTSESSESDKRIEENGSLEDNSVYPTRVQSAPIEDDVSSLSSSAISRSITLTSEGEQQLQRRGTTGSVNTNYYSLNPITSRSIDLRKMKSQDMQDVINEYSEFDRLKSDEVKRVVSLTSDLGVEEVKKDDTEKPVTFWEKFKRGTISMLINFRAPNSLSLIISIIIAMSPPLKALFVKTSFYMPHAPDLNPPLSFIMDLTSYVGAASVPLGLLLLGATIARLKVNAIIPGFWKTVVAITAARLIIMPIFGVGLTTGINNGGWFLNDKVLRFVSVLEFGLPNATALVYFTAFYTDPQAEDHLQMDCLALCLIAQYSILFITLPFLVTFSLKVSLGL